MGDTGLIIRSPRDGTHRDPLYRMRTYELAAELVEAAWGDAEKLAHHRVTEKIAGQLYAAVGSIKANIADGYSRSSGSDRARFFEYALSSTRESRSWYEDGSAVLGEQTVEARYERLEEIRRLLLAIIPRERDRLIRPTSKPHR